MKKQTIQEIEIFCYSTVGNMLAMMSNKKYRGDCFNWDEFPEMMRCHCTSTIGSSVRVGKTAQAECEDYAGRRGFEIASDYIRIMSE